MSVCLISFLSKGAESNGAGVEQGRFFGQPRLNYYYPPGQTARQRYRQKNEIALIAVAVVFELGCLRTAQSRMTLSSGSWIRHKLL